MLIIQSIKDNHGKNIKSFEDSTLKNPPWVDVLFKLTLADESKLRDFSFGFCSFLFHACRQEARWINPGFLTHYINLENNDRLIFMVLQFNMFRIPGEFSLLFCRPWNSHILQEEDHISIKNLASRISGMSASWTIY